MSTHEPTSDIGDISMKLKRDSVNVPSADASN